MSDRENNNKKSQIWVSVVEDVEDGSGDAIIPLPDELLEEMGWDENTLLEISLTSEGNIVVRKSGDGDPFANRVFATLKTCEDQLFPFLKEKADALKKKAVSSAKAGKDRVSHAVMTTVPYMRARDAYYEIKGNHALVKLGYNPQDAWNLGDSTLRRMAELLYTMALENYSQADPKWVEELRENAILLNGYIGAAAEIELMWMDSGFHDTNNGKKSPKAVMEELSRHLRENLASSWEWIGNNIFSERFNMPDGYDAYIIPVKHSFYEDGYMISFDVSWLPFNTPSDLEERKATRRLERRKSLTGLSRADIAVAPWGELMRLSSLFYEMGRRAYGYPEGYLSSNDQFQQRDEYWGERQALATSLMGNPSVIQHDITYKTDNGHIGIRKNKDIGDYAAWIEDITNIASIFAKYACWLAPDGLKIALSNAGVPQEEIEEIDKIHRKNFQDAWTWVGKNIDMLWA